MLNGIGVLSACLAVAFLPRRSPAQAGAKAGVNLWLKSIYACQTAALCYSLRMTETLTIRLPKSLARQFRAKTRAARTNPTAVLREAAAKYVRNDPSARNAIVEHIRARAGTWDSDISGEELLRKTRP